MSNNLSSSDYNSNEPDNIPESSLEDFPNEDWTDALIRPIPSNSQIAMENILRGILSTPEKYHAFKENYPDLLNNLLTNLNTDLQTAIENYGRPGIKYE